MSYKNILFLDLEVIKDSYKIVEVGLVYKDKSLKTSSIEEAKRFIEINNPEYIAGHNFIEFDLEILKNSSLFALIDKKIIIDTLPISLLLFNEKSFHKLPKKYKSEDNFPNDPVEDSKLTKELYENSAKRFLSLPWDRQFIFFSLLHNHPLFRGFLRQ